MRAPEHRGGPPLLAPGLRLPALVAVAVSIAAVVLLGARYAHHSTPGRFDRGVDNWLTGHANSRAALWFADLGNGPVVLVLVLLILVGCVLLRTRRGFALTALAAAIAPSITEWLVKPAVHRTKDGYLAYPSGHATGFCSVALVFVLLLAGPGRRWLPRRAAIWTSIAALLLAAACGLGLVASDYHYATDVLGGVGVAVATVLALALLLDRVAGPAGPGS